VRSIAVAALAVVLGAAGVLVAADDKKKSHTLADLAWLAGDWTTDDGHFDETWLPPKGDAMYAVSRLVEGGHTKFCELSLVEETSDGIWYRIRHFDRALKPWAMDAAGPMSMKLASLTAKEAIFEDPAKSFPRRVVYVRNGDKLQARLEGEQGGKPVVESFDFKLAKK
jgi:hypothetical protein